MTSPSTFPGRRRMALLHAMPAEGPGITVSELRDRSGFCEATVRAHLRFLEGLKMVSRTNYRRWRLADGFSWQALDGARLDP